MSRNPAPTPVVGADALTEGVRAAALLAVSEAHLEYAVGETGKIRLTLEIDLNHGRVQRSRGACFFERIIDIGGH